MLGLVVVLIALVVAGVAMAGDGGETADADAEADRGSSTSVTTSTTTTTTTTAPTTTTVPPPQTVTGADGAFQVTLPAGWGSITVAGDMTGRGAEMFPDDAQHAALADSTLSILVTPQTRFVAMDGTAEPFVDATDMLLVENGPANVSQQEAYDAAKRFMETVTIHTEGRIATPVGEAHWFEFSPPDVPRTGRKYVLVRGGVAWVITYWSGDMPNSIGVAEQILGSFTPA